MRNSTMSLSEKRYLHNCSFRSDKNQRTWDKLITLMKKVCCQLSPFFTRTSTVRPVYEPRSDLSQKRKSSRDLKNERIRILLERQKEKILAEVRSEIQKHELEGESDKRSIQESTGIIDSQRMEIDHTITVCDQSMRDQLLLQEELSEQNRAFRETRTRNMRDMEEFAEKSRVQGRGTFEKKIDWRPKHDYGAKSQNSGLAEWNQLYEWFESILRMPSQSAVDHPMFQSTSVTSTLSWSRRIAKPQQSAARCLEFGRVYRETFLQFHERLLRHLIQEVSILGCLT